MDSRSDQVERNRHLRIELEHAIQLLGPGDFVRSHTPGKAADATQMLGFRKERFTALQRRFTQGPRSEEHTSELQSQSNLVCRLLLEKKKTLSNNTVIMIGLEFLLISRIISFHLLYLRHRLDHTTLILAEVSQHIHVRPLDVRCHTIL